MDFGLDHTIAKIYINASCWFQYLSRAVVALSRMYVGTVLAQGNSFRRYVSSLHCPRNANLTNLTIAERIMEMKLCVNLHAT